MLKRFKVTMIDAHTRAEAFSYTDNPEARIAELNADILVHKDKRAGTKFPKTAMFENSTTIIFKIDYVGPTFDTITY